MKTTSSNTNRNAKIATTNKSSNQQFKKGIRHLGSSPDSKPDPIYVDQFGQKWKFAAQLGAKIADYGNLRVDERKQLHGFYRQHSLCAGDMKRGNIVCLVCKRRKYWTNNKPPYCPVRGKMFKANGALYTIGEHNHHYMEAGENDGIYVDMFGKCWRLIGRAETANALEEFRKQQWLIRKTVGKETINFTCKIGRGALLSRPKCQFYALWVRDTGCLYAYGEHDHPLTYGIYVDIFGKCWRQIGKAETADELEKFRKKQWLNRSYISSETIKFYCKNNGTRERPAKCPFRALWVRETGCLYAYGEHNHSLTVCKIERENDDAGQQQDGISSSILEPNCSSGRSKNEDSTQWRRPIRRCNRKQNTGTVVGSSRSISSNGNEESDEAKEEEEVGEEDGIDQEEENDEEEAMEEDNEGDSSDGDDDFDKDFEGNKRRKRKMK